MGACLSSARSIDLADRKGSHQGRETESLCQEEQSLEPCGWAEPGYFLCQILFIYVCVWSFLELICDAIL